VFIYSLPSNSKSGGNLLSALGYHGHGEHRRFAVDTGMLLHHSYANLDVNGWYCISLRIILYA